MKTDTVHRPKNPDRRQRATRMLAKMLGVSIFAGSVWGLIRVYRWAEPDPNAFRAIGIGNSAPDLALRMDKLDYVNYFSGVKNWSLWAERIDLLRPAGTIGLAGLQRADVTNIRNGKLYDMPETGLLDAHASHASGRPRLAAAMQTEHDTATPPPDLPPSALFSARQGHYFIGMPLTAPFDLQMNYHVLWQFQLTGDVRLRTRQGDRLSAPSLTVLQLTNFRTGKQERRILCDEGVQVTVKNIQVHANSVRYDPVLRHVECLGGVRGALPRPHGQDTIQAEHLYWSLDGQTIRCPETATGVLDGMPFTTAGVNIDIKRHLYEGTGLELKVSPAEDGPLALPVSGEGKKAMIQTAFLKRSSVPVLALGAFSAGATSVSMAQPPQNLPQTKQQAAPAGAAKDPAWDYISFKLYKANSAQNELVGHDFVYTRGDSTTTGDYGHYKRNDDKKTGVLDADGNLVYDDPDHHATCNKAHVDTKIKLAVFTENVVLVLKPAKHPVPAAQIPQNGAMPPPAASQNSAALPPPAPGTNPPPAADNPDDRDSQKQYGATVTCDKMEDQYRKKYIKLFGHLVFKQQRKGPDGKMQERILTAEHAEYNGKSEILELYGQVDGRDFNGSELHAPDGMTVNTKEGEETIEGKNGTFKFAPEEDTGDDAESGGKDAKGAADKNKKGQR